MEFRDAITNCVNSAMLTYENHNTNNSFLGASYRMVDRMLKMYDYEPVGTSKNIPFCNHSTAQIAFVYRYEDEIYWCHLPEICWKKFLVDIYGSDNLEEIPAAQS